MIRVNLNIKEKKVLKELRKYHRGAISERVQYLLLSGEGKSIEEISQQTNRHPHTIRMWLKRYLQGGIKMLKGKVPTGRPPQKISIGE